MTLATKQALACWIVTLALLVAALFVALGPPKSADGAAEAIGRLFANTGIAALIGWAIARKKTPAWSWARFALVYAALVVGLAVVAGAGRAHAATPAWTPASDTGARA